MKLVMCGRVCFRMCGPVLAAHAAATRAVSRGAQVEQVDLDLTGPDRNCPFAFEDDPAAPNVSPEDSSVSDVAVPASLVPPAARAPSAEQERFRTEVRSAASGTVRTDRATLPAIALKVTAKLSSCVLLMVSEGAFYAFLQQRSCLGPSPRRPSRGSQPFVGAM